ncbi:MAG TPA: nuclear transport factor 2 family protein [Candidatus Limnocylindrales bacterium]|nr:nuclear transport factor 2 family protein [Candidatus Limnocylindrales bacterium]
MTAAPTSHGAMAPSSEITATMLEFYRRMLAGEADAANDLISRDPAIVFIGSAGEWVDDQDTLRSGKLEPGEGVVAGPSPSAWARGDVGFFVDQPTWVFGDGSKAEMRLSAVLQREPDGWRIVQVHQSVAVPDDQCVMLQKRWTYGVPTERPGS